MGPRPSSKPCPGVSRGVPAVPGKFVYKTNVVSLNPKQNQCKTNVFLWTLSKTIVKPMLFSLDPKQHHYESNVCSLNPKQNHYKTIVSRLTLSKNNVKHFLFRLSLSKTNVKPMLCRWLLSKTCKTNACSLSPKQNHCKTIVFL